MISESIKHQKFVKTVRGGGEIAIPVDIRRFLGINKGTVVECTIRVLDSVPREEEQVATEEAGL